MRRRQLTTGVTSVCRSQRQFTVRPFHCLVGPFQSDALLVPEHCVFDHVHNSKRCSSHDDWNHTALESCNGRGYQLQSFAILQPCGIDKFNGVEFVCCPRDKVDKTTLPASTEVPNTNSPPSIGTTAQQQHQQGRLLRGDNSLSDGDYIYDNNKMDSNRLKERWNEHEYYFKARTDLQRHHHEKIAKMMKEWSSARERVQEVKEKNTETEASVEKRQLALLHQQRVQAEMGDRKRHLLQKYVEAVDVDETDIDAGRVLKTLIRYVKALQKDRIHIMNRYRHQLQSSPADAEANRPLMVDHLASSDHQLSAALHMLDRLTLHKNKIMTQIREYLSAYHAVDANILALFGPLETSTTSTTTTTTTTPAPTTTTTELLDAILADEDDEYADDDYYEDEYSYEQGSEPVSWEEQQFKNAMKDKRIFNEDTDNEDDDEEDDEDDDEDEFDDDDYYDYDDDDYEDDLWSEKLPSSSDDSASSTDNDDDDDDDDKPLSDYASVGDSSERRHDSIDDTDAFDYVRVQLPMGGHGDNIAKSRLTANQAMVEKVPLKPGVDTFSAVPLGIAVGCITVFVVIVAGIVVMRRRGAASRRYGQRRAAGAPARLPLDPTASPEERHVAAMQMTGYENPTYKYFEASPATA